MRQKQNKNEISSIRLCFEFFLLIIIIILLIRKRLKKKKKKTKISII